MKLKAPISNVSGDKLAKGSEHTPIHRHSSKMYNSNLTPNLLLGVPVGEGTGATPRTPEIVNSLMAMTDPFKLIRAGAGAGGGVRLANSPPSSNSNSIVAASSSPPSLQHTRTQLIKEGLKLTIQSKRKSSLSVSEEHQPAPAPLAQAVIADRPSRNRTMSEDVSQDSQDYSSGGILSNRRGVDKRLIVHVRRPRRLGVANAANVWILLHQNRTVRLHEAFRPSVHQRAVRQSSKYGVHETFEHIVDNVFERLREQYRTAGFAVGTSGSELSSPF
ncbi:unnamed protein product [Nesidiocoris tenuis]|uniref:Uncharacterized protein n=1 Tax=Nesidiocoris tenuis TaxID=355587 RepID=A0A6H5GL62_9HEMI|nr:unnamed protein product [Nesidiocoris tenuis]